METAPPVASVKKKTATKTKPEKVLLKVSVPKKAAVKGGKKSSPKLTIKNKTEKTKEVTQADRLEHKMSKVEALHGTKKASAALTLPEKPSRKLMIQSPFRFPLDTERIASQTARYGGLALVTAGASLALFYAQLVELPISALSQLGAACASSDLLCLMREQQNTLAPVTNTTTTEQQTIPEVVQQTNTVPGTVAEAPVQTAVQTVNKLPAIFTIGSPEPLKNTVQINVTVADAQSVVLSAYFEEWNRNLSLGSARRENGAWIYSWNTTKFENGRYRIKALIKNDTGTYEQVSDTFVNVKNVATAPAVSTAAVPAATTEAETAGPLKVSVSSNGARMTLIQTFPEVTSSDIVRVYLVNKADETSTYVDDSYLFTQAYKKTNVTWKQTFEIGNFERGEYIVRAERWRGDVLVDTTKASVTLSGSRVVEPIDSGNVTEGNATVSVQNANSLKGFADVNIEANDATFVEVYAVNTASVNNLFIGLARKSSVGIWILNWDTKQIPNSRYQLFARIGSSHGTYESNKVLVTVQNERVSAPTTSQVEELSTRTQQYEELLPDNIVVRNNFWNVTTATTTAPKLNDFIELHKDRIQEELQKLAAALRSGNESAIAAANTRLVGLENEYRDFIDGEDNFDELLAAFTEYIGTARSRIETDVDKIERIIAERTNDGLFSDTDWDGITDFDELYIYNTDPFLADTSGNGIPDGVAILNGLDPRSSDSDASIVFESPQDVGIIQNDLLHVESITAVESDGGSVDVETIAPAVIAGKALPNSFVTIFIFSTPIIVTVKTESDGSWQYRFEKELENGEHSVYVAMTDNSGRIIARSSAFKFIKEAQAYTTVDEALADYSPGATVRDDYSFFSSSIIYLVMSFAVVTIGLVLLLLGMYIDRRRRQEELVAPIAASV